MIRTNVIVTDFRRLKFMFTLRNVALQFEANFDALRNAPDSYFIMIHPLANSSSDGEATTRKHILIQTLVHYRQSSSFTFFSVCSRTDSNCQRVEMRFWLLRLKYSQNNNLYINTTWTKNQSIIRYIILSCT